MVKWGLGYLSDNSITYLVRYYGMVLKKVINHVVKVITLISGQTTFQDFIYAPLNSFTDYQKMGFALKRRASD